MSATGTSDATAHPWAPEEEIRGRSGLKHSVTPFRVKFEYRGLRTPVTSIVLDLAATLFIPESPKVFCGLKHFHPTLHRHSAEEIMSGFSFFGELSHQTTQ